MSNPARFNTEKVGDMIQVAIYFHLLGRTNIDQSEKNELTERCEQIVEEFYESELDVCYINEYLTMVQPSFNL